MSSWRKPAQVAASLGELAHQLTERDFAIVEHLSRFRLLTIVQLERVFFDSASSAYDRVKTLCERGLLDRRRPSTHEAYRYFLGWHGLSLVHSIASADFERDPGMDLFGRSEKPKPGRAPTKLKARQHADKLFFSSHRSHLEGVNDFYTRLAYSCRSSLDAKLRHWYVEHEAERVSPASGVRADGCFDLVFAGREREFWYEYDTGTEPLDRLVGKIDWYNQEIARHRSIQDQHIKEGKYTREQVLAQAPPRMMLIEFTKPGREANLHDRLAAAGGLDLVATSTAARSGDPLGSIWRCAGTSPGEMRRLAEVYTLRHL
jgi:predicted transcriptional regulator